MIEPRRRQRVRRAVAACAAMLLAILGALISAAPVGAVPPPASITIYKYVQLSEANADGSQTITYTIFVDNTGGAGTYDLSDQLGFGAGITISSASAAIVAGGPAVSPVNPAWDGTTEPLLAENVPIATDEFHHYQVVVVADANAVEDGAGECTGLPGGGFFNEASVTFDGTTLTSNACVRVPDLVVYKEVSAPPTLNPDGTISIEYVLSVENRSDTASSYTLVDYPAFAAPVTSATATAIGATPPPNPAWDGTNDTLLTLTDPITGESLSIIPGNTTFQFRINMTAAASPMLNDFIASCQVPYLTDNARRGMTNKAILITQLGELSEAHACEAVPRPSLTVTKTAGELQPTGTVGVYDLDYTVTIENDGDAPGAYQLADQFEFAPGVTVQSVSVENTVPGDIAVNPAFNGADDVDITTGVGAECAPQVTGTFPCTPIAGRTTHEYVVSVQVDTTNVSNPASFTCDAGEAGTGLGNIATLVRLQNPRGGGGGNNFVRAAVPDGVITTPQTDDECVAIPMVADLSLAKRVSAAVVPMGNPVTYTVTATNAGPHIATNVEIVDTLPAGITLDPATLAVTPGSAAPSGSTIVWSIPSLAPGATATMIYSASVNAVGPSTNTVEVTRSDASDPDSTPGNGAPSEDDRAEATVEATPSPTTTTPPTTTAPPATTIPPPVTTTPPSSTSTTTLPPPAPTTTVPRSVWPAWRLPSTGSTVVDNLGAAALLLGAGVLTLMLTRRRKGTAR